MQILNCTGTGEGTGVPNLLIVQGSTVVTYITLNYILDMTQKHNRSPIGKMIIKLLLPNSLIQQ